MTKAELMKMMVGEIDLREVTNLTTKEFANIIDENHEVIDETLRACEHLACNDHPYYPILVEVYNSAIKDDNRDIVVRFIYRRIRKRIIDLRELTTKAFAEMVGEDYETVRELLRKYDYLGYTDNPYYHIVVAVQNSSVKDSNKEIVAKFIYTSICNRNIHRYYHGRGYGVTFSRV